MSDYLMDNTRNDLISKEEFNFNAEHNGVGCIASLRPEDRGTENQFWWNVAGFVTIFDEVDSTIRRNIISLDSDGEVDLQKCKRTVTTRDSEGRPHSVTLYNLEVLNKLGMCCFRGNKKAKEIRNKFSDVLVRHETGTVELSDAEIMSRALEIAHRTLAAREERIRALEVERDEAVRTKYQFVEGRDAKVCGELGGLRTQNENLRKQIGDSKTYKAVTAITWLPDYFNMSNRGLYSALAARLKKTETEMGQGFEHIDIPDSKWGKVKAYHVAVIERLHEVIQADETFMCKYRKIASV